MWQGIAGRRPHGLRSVSLCVALILSAALTAVSLRLSAAHWLAWVSLLPLFQAIRTLRRPMAAMAGGLWGVCLFLFAGHGPAPVIEPSVFSFAMLTTMPTLYAGLGALLTRRIGFNPLVLALGWVGVELAFRPLGLPLGLLAGTQSGGPVAHWTGKLLGYVLVAFLVAVANASLLALLGRVRLGPARRRLRSDFSDATVLHLSQTSVFIQHPFLCRAGPRAPPMFASSRSS